MDKSQISVMQYIYYSLQKLQWTFDEQQFVNELLPFFTYSFKCCWVVKRGWVGIELKKTDLLYKHECK